jgi:FkbM family methyltransferase
MTMNIMLRGMPTSVDADYEDNLGIYGKEFWSLINRDAYEPTTFDFIQQTYKPGACFFDIGAATGCMSLYAAQLGYNVVSIEPQQYVFEALRRNVALNSNLQAKIELIHALVVSTESKDSGEMSDFFTSGASGPLDRLTSSVDRISINDLFLKSNTCIKTVFKVDIEGAEFNLLRDTQLLSELKAHNSIMFLSLHPGFLRPLQRSGNLARLVWLARATREVSLLYFRLRKYSIIKDSKGRTKMNLIVLLRHLQRDLRDFQIHFQ